MAYDFDTFATDAKARYMKEARSSFGARLFEKYKDELSAEADWAIEKIRPAYTGERTLAEAVFAVWENEEEKSLDPTLQDNGFYPFGYIVWGGIMEAFAFMARPQPPYMLKFDDGSTMIIKRNRTFAVGWHETRYNDLGDKLKNGRIQGFPKDPETWANMGAEDFIAQTDEQKRPL